jgi:hypothetical protein
MAIADATIPMKPFFSSLVVADIIFLYVCLE